jgi:hypothetical protein
MKLLPEMPPPSSQLLAKNYSQRLRSFRPDTHMKHWIIAALICSACAAYASEDDNKIHPTCVDDATRADVGSSRAAHRSEAPQLQPVVPAPQAAIPPPAPAIVCPFHPRRDGGPPPLIFRFGPYGLTVPRRYAGSPSAEHRLTEPRPIAYSWMALAGGAKLHLDKYEESVAWLHRSIQNNRNAASIAHFFLAAGLAQLSRIEEGRAATRTGLALNPMFTINRFRAGAETDNLTFLTQRERIYEGMRKAGVPEQ